MDRGESSVAKSRRNRLGGDVHKRGTRLHALDGRAASVWAPGARISWSRPQIGIDDFPSTLARLDMSVVMAA
jgi:hypothetical protein